MPSRHRARAAALVLISVLVLSACGGSDGTHPPETVGTARRAIESLPYKIDVREITGQDGALLGELHGKLGETERFYVFVHGRGPLRINDVVHALGVRDAEQIEGGELTESYALFSPVIKRTGETRRQIEEGSSAIYAAEEALCEQATGESCGI
jgi:hypothetical protein